MVRLLNTRTPTGRENKTSRGPRVRHSQSNVSAIRGSEAVFNQPATRSPNRVDLPAPKGTGRELEGSLPRTKLRS